MTCRGQARQDETPLHRRVEKRGCENFNMRSLLSNARRVGWYERRGKHLMIYAAGLHY